MCRISVIKVRPRLDSTLALLLLAIGLTTAQTVLGAWSTDPSLVIWQNGPKPVKLKQTATVQMPAGFRFADGHSTMRVLQAAGQPVSKREMGMIIPEDGGDGALIFQFSEIGYLSDSRASRLDANQLLKTLNQKIESANQEARKSGKPALSKFAWEQTPVYRASNHSLEWVLRTETQGQTNIEYHLDFLGRQGVMEVKLACDAEKFKALSPAIKEMLSSFSYISGQRYSDTSFKSKLAQGSFEGLITGETVKLEGKLGFWATVLLIVKKIFRLIMTLLVVALIAAAVGAGYFFYKLYSGGSKLKEGAAPE